MPLAGNKKDNITVIYTPWSNLKKDGSMAVGQVGFEDPRMVHDYPQAFSLSRSMPKLTCLEQVKKIHIPQRENPIVNRLNKTKVEKKPDLKQEKEERQRELRKREQAIQHQRVSTSTLRG